MSEDIKDDIRVDDIEPETGDDEPEIELEPDDEGAEEPDKGDEPEPDGDSEKEPEGEEKSEPEPEEDRKVSLKALEAERRKWKERLEQERRKSVIADKLTQATGKTPEQILAEMDALEQQRYVENGVDPAIAQELVAIRRQNETVMRELKRKERDLEFQALKNNALYTDIDLYRDEVEDYADRTGLSVKAAYLELHGERRLQEIEREIEQRVLNSIAKKQARKVDTTPSGEPDAKPRVKATPEQEAMAKMAGMSVAEYLALMKVQTPDQYRKLKNRK